MFNEIEQSIYIILSSNANELKGDKVATVTQETINQLHKLIYKSEKLNSKANKLRIKVEQSKRQSRKLLDRIVASHGVKLDNHKQAVGISKKDDTIYVGDKDRIIENPEAPPQFGDKIVGKLLKHEKRKYNELVDKYNYLAKTIEEHNKLVQENENQLIKFEKKILKSKKYNKEKDYLVVSISSGDVYLVTNK